MTTDTRLIPLTQGKFAIVDACDYEYLMQWKWFAQRQKTTRGDIWHAKRLVSMEQEISKRKGFAQIKGLDHKNKDGLDNRRENIRECTKAQQCQNREKFRGKSSIHKGVSYVASTKKWTSKITVNRKTTFLGLFTSEIEAAKAYKTAAMQLFGEFASFD